MPRCSLPAASPWLPCRGWLPKAARRCRGLAKRFLQIPAEAAAAHPAGPRGRRFAGRGESGGLQGRKDGSLYPVDIRCPHLGCQLEWNPDERSWDCPCHGSRFDRFGRLLSGPAMEDICHG